MPSDKERIANLLGGSVPLPRPRQEGLLGMAQQQYPVLKNHDVGFKYSPGRGNGFLEFWPPNESGSASLPRPNEFKNNAMGVEVFNPETKPIDIAGDITSHHLVNADPRIKEIYQQFSSSLQPWQHDQLSQQYEHAKSNFGETRPFDSWKEASGLPAYFRGYPFKQWENSEQMYTPDQLKLLDGMMNYLGGKEQ